MAANWRTVVLRDVDQGPTHLAVLNADGPTDAGISVSGWLQMHHWPRTSCGLYSTPKALCGQRVQDQPMRGIILEAPDTPVQCESCRQAPVHYPMLDTYW